MNIHMIRSIFSVFLIAAGLVLLLGFCGRIHGACDTLAVLRPLFLTIVGLLSLVALLGSPRWLGMLGVCLTAIAGLSLIPPTPVSYIPEDARLFSAYQKNLLFRLPDTRPVADDILKTRADFVMLQELHVRNRPILAELRAEYPYQHFCPFAAVGGIAVLSRWPSVEGRTKCGEGSGLAAMQVETPEGPLWIVSLHLHWPFPYRQPEQIEVLLPILEELNAPVLIGGDHNMVAWSYAVKSIAIATETTLSGYVGGTFAFSFHNEGRNLAGWIPRVPIDHILVPEKGATLNLQRRERFGSDHHGLLANFVIDAQF